MWDKIEIHQNEQEEKTIRIYPIRLLNERAKYKYFWKYFRSWIKDELDDEIWVMRMKKGESWGKEQSPYEIGGRGSGLPNPVSGIARV
jgi:hypothetical protein